MGVEDWKGDYILRFEGVNTGCPLVTGARVRRWMRALAELTPGRLRSLNYPATPASFALVLKNANLLVPEMAHLGGLDVSDPVAREAFVERWAFRSMSREAGLRLFGLRTFPGQFDKKKLIRNIIFQVWRWIRLGIRPPIHNIVRRGWYECVKPVLQNWRILEAPDYDRYFNELRELTRMKVLGITYRDFGFLDYEEGLYFGVGSERPDILLYTEKSEAKRFVDEILDRLKASYIVNHGQPNRFRVESVALDIADRVPGQVVHLVSLVDFNPGGVAIEAAGVEGLSYHDVPVQVHRVLELRALSPDEVEEFKAPLVEVIRYDDGRVEFTMGNPSYVTQCENWFQEILEDDRFREVKPVPGGTQITYYGFDADILGADWIRYRLGRIVQRILSMEPAAGKVRPTAGRAVPVARWVARYRRDHGLRSAGRRVKAPVEDLEDLGVLALRYGWDPPRYG